MITRVDVVMFILMGLLAALFYLLWHAGLFVYDPNSLSDQGGMLLW